MLCHVVVSPLVQSFMWFPRENITGVQDVGLGLLQCGGGVWGLGPSLVGVGRFYGRLVLERVGILLTSCPHVRVVCYTFQMSHFYRYWRSDAL